MPRSHRYFGVFLPELPTFRKKDSRACRELPDDVALIEPATNRVIASRGKRFALALPQACFAQPLRRTLLPDDGGCFLLFPELFPDTGFTLALFFRVPAVALSAALTALARTDFDACAPTGEADPALCNLLSELLFYLDGLFRAGATLPLWTVILRSANFAGCKLCRAQLPMSNLSLSPEDAPAVIAFLLYFFLLVRHDGDEATAEEETRSPAYQIRLSSTRGFPSPEPEATIALPACAAFQHFRFFTQNGRLAALLPIHPKPRAISSSGAAAPCLLLVCAPSNPNLSPIHTKKHRFYNKRTAKSKRPSPAP